MTRHYDPAGWRFIFLTFTRCYVLIPLIQSDQLQTSRDAAQYRRQIQEAVGDVKEKYAGFGEFRKIKPDGLLRQKMHRYRIRAEGVQYDQIVIMVGCVRQG